MSLAELNEMEVRGRVGPAAMLCRVASGSTATSIVAADFQTVANRYQNGLLRFETGQLAGQEQAIASHTATTFTVASAFTAAPAVGDIFVIITANVIVADVSENVAQWAGTAVAAPLDDNSDAVAAATGGIPRFLARLTAWTGSAWTRLRLAASGALSVRDDATGAPGAAVPGAALQVGGTDGTDLRALATDATGVAKVQGGYTEGAPGAAAPTRAVQVGGTDGTDLRALRTDPAGNPAVWNEQAAGPSTTTPLAANATFTSTTQSGGGFARITGTVLADQAGTLNIDQSPDGTNWDVTSSFSIAANTGQGFSVEIVAPNWRLRYVNGATAQTTFRLYSWTRRI